MINYFINFLIIIIFNNLINFKLMIIVRFDLYHKFKVL